MFRALREGLRAPMALPLLETVSAIMTAADPRSRDPWAPAEEGPELDLGELVESLIGTPYAETTAALIVIVAFTTDDALKARITTELAGRRHPLPAWLAHLSEARADAQVWHLRHVLGEQADYLVGAQLQGEAVTALVHVDHSVGGAVVDAAFAPDDIENVVINIGTEITDADLTLERADPADVRAAVERAIKYGAMLVPRPETERWPGARALVDWLVRMLPEGGQAPERREWSEEEWDAEVATFLASRFGKPFRGDEDARSLGQSIMWFATEYTAGDPHRLSPGACAQLLEDWAPRKIIAEPAYLAGLPDVLRAFVQYGHAQAGIAPHLTQEALEAIDETEPLYQRLIRSERAQGAAALVEAMLEAQEPARSVPELMLVAMAERVGGRARLTNLSLDPLPDEDFEWAGIPDDARPQVTAVVEACDAFADEVLDVELRTAMRRFLSRAAAADPAIFRRRSLPVWAAAAIAWVLCSANNDFGTLDPSAPVRALQQHFGVKGGLSDRAAPMMLANGVHPYVEGPLVMGAPDLLTSTTRSEIAQLRDYWLDREE